MKDSTFDKSQYSHCTWRSNAEFVCATNMDSIVSYHLLSSDKKYIVLQQLLDAFRTDYSGMGISTVESLKGFVETTFVQGNVLFTKFEKIAGTGKERFKGCIAVDTTNSVAFISHQLVSNFNDFSTLRELQKRALDYCRRFEFSRAVLWCNVSDMVRNQQLGWTYRQETQTHYGWKIVMDKCLNVACI